MSARNNSSSSRSTRSSHSAYSHESSHTQSTAPTSYSDHRPVVKRYDTCPGDFGYLVEEPLDYRNDINPRSSVETYASTVSSSEDLSGTPQYDHPTEGHDVYPSNAVASTPPDFAELFPSTRRLLIRHDDSTSDGNMNLRVDTELSTTTGRTVKMTLFHLRMQDLQERKFSLRRYCRESGREVCSSVKKYAKPNPPKAKRPTIQRSLTSALQHLGAKAVPSSFRRHESGYESDGADDLVNFKIPEVKATIPTKTIKLEFSNYAQVGLHRQKHNSQKQYAFEYWGTPYYWNREVRPESDGVHISYHLIDNTTGKIAAQITPQQLTRKEVLREEHKGGWVPPCEMVICDPSITEEMKTDLADVIVATGLTALVDDCIKRHWHSKEKVRLQIPSKKASDYVGPKRLIDEVFNRRGYTAH